LTEIVHPPAAPAYRTHSNSRPIPSWPSTRKASTPVAPPSPPPTWSSSSAMPDVTATSETPLQINADEWTRRARCAHPERADPRGRAAHPPWPGRPEPL